MYTKQGIIERWLKRFDPANPYMSYFHIGTSKEQVKQMRQELKILKQQEKKKWLIQAGTD